MFDFETPTILLQRYDSYSSVSGSNKSSLSSSLSFDAGSPRTSQSSNNERSENRLNISTTSKENRNIPQRRINRTRDLSHIELSDNENDCIFCNSKVYERQYYMWQSAYTKSSLCSRCSEDNNSLNYISYWGTSSYQSGSWRKRYKEGTSTDIDLSPLLQVLGRIDRIDTSICGYTYSKDKVTKTETHNTNNNAHQNQDLTNTEADFKMSERRKRRLRNRESLSNYDKTSTTDKYGNVSDKITSGVNVHKSDQLQSDVTQTIAIEIHEISEAEDLDVIEPLVYEQANESISQLNEDATDIDRSYLDFIAGLGNDYKRERCSSMAHERSKEANSLLIAENQASGIITNELMNMVTDCTQYDNANNDNCDHTNLNTQPEMAKIDVNESEFCKENYNTIEHVGKGFEKDKRKTELSEIAKKINNNSTDPLCYKQIRKQSFSQPRRGRRYSKPVVDTLPRDNDESFDMNDSEQLSFIDKKRKFEMMQNTRHEQLHSTKSTIENVSRGQFRSQYLNRSVCEKDNLASSIVEQSSPNYGNNQSTAPIETKEDNVVDISSTFEITIDDTEDEPVDKTNTSSSDWIETSFSTTVSGQSIFKTLTEIQEKNNIEVISNTTSNTSISSTSVDDVNNSHNTVHSGYNASISDKSISIPNTPNTSRSSIIGVNTEMGVTNANNQEKAMRRQSRINSIEARNTYTPRRRRESKNTERSIADDELSDVPHVERLKKKLGRVKDDDDDDDDQTGRIEDTIEIDVSNNEQKELSWRTRGYSVDFFMSRQSITGSEILERYNRAISRRRQRKRAKATPFPYGTSNDLDNLVSGSEQVSRKQSMSLCVPRLTASEPLTRSASFKRRDSSSSTGSDKVANNTSGISPKALQEALNRAAACSNRLKVRLQAQLDDSSCDSSS